MKTAIELITEERVRQIVAEGFDARHDDGYVNGELAMAGATYAIPAIQHICDDHEVPFMWPWPAAWWRPTPDDRIKELVKAGALIAAEIERLQRIQNGET